MTTTSPKIYVACLAAYNNGKLHGAWIDALDNTPDQIMEEVQAMLQCSPEPDAEEWAIHDYEGFEDVSLSEWTGFEQVYILAQFIDEYGALGAKLLAYCGEDTALAREMMEEQYQGCYTRLADFAEELTTETTQIPESLQYYIDFERMADDMEMAGDIITIKTTWDKVHVFWSR